MAGARPDCVSDRAKERQRREMGTLGSGNHYLEVQAVAEIFDTTVADVFGLAAGRRCRHHPLRFARPRPSDRNRVPERDGRDCGRRPVSIFLIANSPARRSIRKSANATSARCGRRSIARSPIARFSATTSAASSRTSFRTTTCVFCSMSRTTLARSSVIVVDGKRRDLFVHRKGATRAFGPGSREPARGAASGRPAGADRRQHGHGLIRSGRRSDERGEGVLFGVPRRGPGAFPPCGAQAMERAQDRR